MEKKSTYFLEDFCFVINYDAKSPFFVLVVLQQAEIGDATVLWIASVSVEETDLEDKDVRIVHDTENMKQVTFRQ